MDKSTAREIEINTVLEEPLGRLEVALTKLITEVIVEAKYELFLYGHEMTDTELVALIRKRLLDKIIK